MNNEHKEQESASLWWHEDVEGEAELPHGSLAKLTNRIAAALSSRDTEIKEAQAKDIRTAAKEIARFIESTTTLAVGQPMIAVFETIIQETCFRAVPAAPPQVDDEQ